MISHHLDVVNLTETRVSGDRANRIIVTLCFGRYINVDAMGFVEGIWTLWNPNVVCIHPMATSFQEIHLECWESDKNFLLTAIYASPFFERQILLWFSFMNLAPLLNIP